ncbi:branched-chain amino acid ABC transporter permease [Alteribacillus iranensis]|uniref:Branched-chain amino acid transport system permease protein n=1 Tax=Alteribacillus iranensis TaxID=930128 RepID=A0A1I2EKX7_9BACI|nr:branched-chain amino acid ABC transporter permease [Alteribacillus iranensis]SFE93146.1 branched-chain amino acid transport system permease protein [Alteribacillus iranensis]
MLNKIPKFTWVFVGLFLLTIIFQERFFLDMLVMTFIWAAIASAWNITGGYAGQFSLGHAGFLGLGAYTSTILYVNFGISPWVGMLIGGIIAAALAYVISILCLRLKGPFFTLATIAFAELIFISATQLRGVTQGSMGMSIPYEPGFANMIFVETKTYAIIMFIFMIIVYLLSSYIKRSKMGFYLTAVKEDPDAAQSLGINIKKIKSTSACISAFFTAIGGTLLANYLLFIEPENVLELQISIHIAMIAIVGGMNSPAGPIIGSILLTPLEIILRGYATQVAGLHLMFFGLILILVVLYKPNGLVEGFKMPKFMKKKALTGGDPDGKQIKAS